MRRHNQSTNTFLGMRSEAASKAVKLFLLALPSIIIAWVLISLWTQFVETLAYSTCKLDKTIWSDSLIVAVVVTVFLVIVVYVTGLVSPVAVGNVQSSVNVVP